MPLTGRDSIRLYHPSAAQAESGGFAAALDSAKKSLAIAPTESQDQIRERIALYQDKKPYRLK